MQNGIFCPKEHTNVLTTCNRVQGIEFDSQENVFYKTYIERPDTVPFSLFMSKRHPDHYMNANARVNQPLAALQKNTPIVCLNSNLFGLYGTVNFVDYKKQCVKVNFDTAMEENKVHDPFIGRRHLEAAMTGRKGDKRRQFFQDYDIEKILKAPKATVSRMTSSFLISYKGDDNEKKVVDIGLNIKNFSKKLHVPRYVRFVTSQEDLVINQFEDQGFEHKRFGGRG